MTNRPVAAILDPPEARVGRVIAPVLLPRNGEGDRSIMKLAGFLSSLLVAVSLHAPAFAAIPDAMDRQLPAASRDGPMIMAQRRLVY